jgi:hypothetical protein
LKLGEGGLSHILFVGCFFTCVGETGIAVHQSDLNIVELEIRREVNKVCTDLRIMSFLSTVYVLPEIKLLHFFIAGLSYREF